MDLSLQPTSGTLKNGNRRRFGDGQIKFLECMFESESRPESQIKNQLANELGLQPRQVSVWFQNRRARLKTKQVEKEYNQLKASHDALASSFDSLRRENQLLVVQLRKLKKMHAEKHESRNSNLDQTQSSSNQRRENRVTDYKTKEKPGQPLKGDSNIEGLISSTHDSRSTEGWSREETDTFNLTEYTDGSIISSGWHSFESNSFLDESSSQWWEFLP